MRKRHIIDVNVNFKPKHNFDSSEESTPRDRSYSEPTMDIKGGIKLNNLPVPHLPHLKEAGHIIHEVASHLPPPAL